VRIESDSALVDASGTITIELARVPAHEEWWVQVIAISCTSTVQTIFYAFRDEPELSRVIDKTERGNFNVAEEESARWIASGARILVAWYGASMVDSQGNPTRGECSMQIASRRI
jgi:hypothetical protein